MDDVMDAYLVPSRMDLRAFLPPPASDDHA